MRILLAEDNVADVMLIEEALKRRDLECELNVYSNAEDAINAVKTCGASGPPVPNLILLDFNLPRGHGGDVLAAAAGNSLLNSVPKAILSSFLRPEEMEQARKLGASCFITKPANLADFLREVGTKVSDLLQKSATAATPV